MKTKAADILGLRSGEISLLSTRGYNSVALLKTSAGSIHKYAGFPEAVVKIFRRDCPRERFAKIARWHNEDFGKFPILKSKNFQQSLGAGEYVDKFGKVYFYAVMEYIPGTLLQDFVDLELPLDGSLAKSIINQLFHSIIIPAWNCGLTFSDIQGRNFVLRGDGILAMLDTEQMRHSATEMLAGENSADGKKLRAHLAFHSSPGKVDFNGALPRLLKNILGAAFSKKRGSCEAAKSEIMSIVKEELSAKGGPAEYLASWQASYPAGAAAKSAQRFLERVFASRTLRQ